MDCVALNVSILRSTCGARGPLLPGYRQRLQSPLAPHVLIRILHFAGVHEIKETLLEGGGTKKPHQRRGFLVKIRLELSNSVF
jgi:hypothetical protein